MEDSSDDLVKAREADMVSPFGGTPLRRTTLFLKPSLKPFENSARYLLPSTLFSEPISDLEKLPLQATFKGWSNSLEEWKTWEERLRYKHEHTWRKAWIHEAIKASTYQIHKSINLILGLAQKWYSKTNSFIFSWGEATITLEDIMECGGAVTRSFSISMACKVCVYLRSMDTSFWGRVAVSDTCQCPTLVRHRHDTYS